MEFDYFYGQQAEQFSFYRIPKMLFTDDRFWNVSTDAKLLYGILLDRMNLSARNGWLDSAGRVYIIFTLEETMAALNCGDNKATKLYNELEKKCGLIERKRQGLGKPNLIYVKNFVSGVDSIVESRFKSRENHDSGVGQTPIVESGKPRGNNTDTNYTDYSDTDPFLSSGFCGKGTEGNAIKHQGKSTSPQLAAKSRSDDEVGQKEGISGDTVRRYIRLTELIPELLDMVDNGQIKFNPAVELSYLAREEQKDFLEAMDYAQAAPSLSQAQRIKKLAQSGECTLDAMCEIMNEIKKGELDRVTFKTDSLRKYFPKSYTSKQMEDKIIQLLEQWQKKRDRSMER